MMFQTGRSVQLSNAPADLSAFVHSDDDDNDNDDDDDGGVAQHGGHTPKKRPTALVYRELL